MSETSETYTEREQIEMLLPWYVAGTLEAGDTARVERYLATHPEMAAQLELIREERSETGLANEMRGMPAPGGLERLRASIAREAPAGTKLAHAGRGLWQELKALFVNPTPRAVQWAAMAAAVVLMLQAGVIGGLMTSGPRSGTGTFEVAGGPQAEGIKLLVRFAPTATATAIANVLSSVDAQIVAGPKPGGFFEIRVARSADGKSDKAAVAEKLKAAPNVVSMVLGGDK
jgi:hypothetical protein